MSYDIYLEVDTGDDEPFCIWDTNFTSNVAPMWRKADPQGEGLARLHGTNAGAAAVHLDLMIHNMGREPDEYRKLNPPNGWGDFDSQLAWLKELAAQCRRHHRCTIRIWR